MKIVMVVVISILAVILIAGCTQQQPVTEVYIPGHGSQVYTFSNDLREALLVKTNNPEGIKAIGKNLTRMNIVFDGSNPQDNAYFRVVLTNIGAKVPVYYSYEGRLVYFDSYYFLGDKWYNSSNEEIARPEFMQPALWLSGPSTSNETSLMLVNSTIFLSGKDYKGLTLAGDKFVLLLFGIDNVPNQN